MKEKKGEGREGREEITYRERENRDEKREKLNRIGERRGKEIKDRKRNTKRLRKEKVR